MSLAFAARVPSSEMKPHRHVRLIGEIIRPFWGTDVSDDQILIYERNGARRPVVRPEGQTVGKVYAVVSRSREHRYHVALYDDGQVFCHCRAACGRRKCWHAELVRERKGHAPDG